MSTGIFRTCFVFGRGSFPCLGSNNNCNYKFHEKNFFDLSATAVELLTQFMASTLSFRRRNCSSVLITTDERKLQKLLDLIETRTKLGIAAFHISPSAINTSNSSPEDHHSNVAKLFSHFENKIDFCAADDEFTRLSSIIHHSIQVTVWKFHTRLTFWNLFFSETKQFCFDF